MSLDLCTFKGADETFAPNELRTLFLCPTATLALRVYQKLHTRENPHNFTGALLMPEFLVGGHPINLANMVCLTSDFAGIFFARATPEQLESLRYIVVVNCFYACSSQLMRGAQRARGLCPNLVSVLGLCAKFNTSITSSCQKLFEILSQRSARTSHVYRPLGYELLTKHSFLHNYKHTTLRTLCSFLKATATYYDQVREATQMRVRHAG